MRKLTDKERKKIHEETKEFVDSLEPAAICNQCGLWNDNDAGECSNCGSTDLVRDRY